MEHIKTRKYNDANLIKKRCDDIKLIKYEFEKYLNKETELLGAEAFKIDELRVNLIIKTIVLIYKSEPSKKY